MLLTRDGDGGGSPAAVQRNVRVTVTEQGKDGGADGHRRGRRPAHDRSGDDGSGDDRRHRDDLARHLECVHERVVGCDGGVPEDAGGRLRGRAAAPRAGGERAARHGTLAEAYNDYNLAFTLAKSQGCSARVLQLLDASQAIQGHRAPIDELRNACR